MLKNAPNCTIKNNFEGVHAPKPPWKATSLQATRPDPRKSWIPPPLSKSCIRPWFI